MKTKLYGVSISDRERIAYVYAPTDTAAVLEAGGPSLHSAYRQAWFLNARNENVGSRWQLQFRAGPRTDAGLPVVDAWAAVDVIRQPEQDDFHQTEMQDAEDRAYRAELCGAPTNPPGAT